MEDEMRYTAMIVGFVLATLTAVGAAERSPLDYVEFTVHDITRSKAFYATLFGWTFTDYGPSYASFDDGRIAGGFTAGGMPHPGYEIAIWSETLPPQN